MDFVTDLPSSFGYTIIWVIIDYFTKIAHFVPLRRLPSARALVDLFVAHVVRLHGFPLEVITDRGPQFTSKFWKGVLAQWGVSVKLSSAYHPQTDGQSERLNQTLEQYLRCYVSDSGKNWSTLLPSAEFCYNNNLHSSLGMSPFEALYGYSPRMVPLSPSSPQGPTQQNQTVEHFAKLKEKLEATQERYSRLANRHRRAPPDFQEGDWVWLNSRNIPMPGVSSKFKPRFLGPFKIVKRFSQVSFRLLLPRSWRVHPTFHVSLFKPARGAPRGV